MNKILLLISLLWLSLNCLAQPPVLPQDNVIYQAQAIEVNTANRVYKIVHIGDSHIQADWFSGKVRELLQESYGDAGTGIVFPYKQIKTNGPRSYQSISANTFTANKIVKCKTACDIGIAAYNAQIPAGSQLQFILKNDSLPQYVEMLHQSYSYASPSFYLNQDQQASHYLQTQNGNFQTTAYLQSCASNFQLQAVNDFTLYALLCHNGKPGIRYYTVGANGATFQQYTQSALFFEQLKYLQPDMVIVSLGTNESVSDITQDTFDLHLNNFQQLLTQAIGKIPVIYTTPSDNYLRKTIISRKKIKGKWRKVKKVQYVNNAQVEMIRERLLQFCAQNNIMCWDMYKAIGGDTSMKEWVKTGYAAKDHIHFSKGGYEIQGTLLYEALLNYVFTE
jgi:lysophospholipase L1-like esterase